MSSILTNAGAMTALQTLKTIYKDLATTQNRISTGQRISEASHNAAYWSIATSMRSDNNANSVVQDALGLGAAKVDVAYTGMNAAIEVVDQIKEKVLLAKTSSTDDRAKIHSEIQALQAGLEDMVNGANYAGSNLLTSGAETTIMTSYNRAGAEADARVTTGSITIEAENVRLVSFGGTDGAVDGGILGTDGTASSTAILDINVSTAGEADFDNLLTDIDTVLGNMTTGAAELGAAKQRIDLQTSFVGNLMDAIDRGVGQLVDADMEEESTRLQALQTQQQLGIQALSIANANSQNILALFR